MKTFSLSNFGGVVTGVDPRALRSNDASDMRNVVTEDGSIQVRKGYRNIVTFQASFTAVWGLGYLQGYSGTTLVEEYGSVENLGGTIRPYSRNVTTGAPTILTNAGSAVPMTGSEWVIPTFQGDSFWINPDSTPSVYRHAIGTNNSFTPLSTPTGPSTPLSYVVQYGGGSTGYTQLSFAGINPATPTGIAYTGTATNTGSSLASDNSLKINHTISTNDASFEVDLSVASTGVKDWTYNDIFAFSLGCNVSSFDIDPTSIRVQFTDSTGAIVSIPTSLEVDFGPGPKPPTVTGNYYMVRFAWTDKLRTNFASIKKIKVSYHVRAATSGAAGNILYVSKPFIGGVWMQMPLQPDVLPGLTFNYSYYYTSSGLESGLTTAGQVFVPIEVLQGWRPFPSLLGLGVHLRFTETISPDANVDFNRLYVKDHNGQWRRIVSQADATLTYDYKLTYPDVLKLQAYDPGTGGFTGVTNAFAFKGSFVWLYRGGYQNVRFSQIGVPEAQASSTDNPANQARGETFSLADNYSDEPLCGFQAGDAAIICGKAGVYAMVGSFPSEMTPPKKVPGSFGCAGKFAAARWKADSGQPGVVFVTPEGQVCFVSVSPQFSGDDGAQVIELSESIRTGAASLRTYLVDGQPLFSFTDLSGVRVFVDEAQDCLVVALGRRALVYRKPSLADGQRHWEPYEYETGSTTTSLFAFVAASTKRRVRFMRSNGKFDEWEWNSSTLAYIEGTLRDGGAAMPGGTIYWQSHTFTTPGEVWRLSALKVVRDDYTDLPTLTCYSSNVPGGISFIMTSGYHSQRFGPGNVGSELYFRVALSEGDGAVRRIEPELYAAGRNRQR